MVAELHRVLAYFVVGACGVTGLLGIGLAVAKRDLPGWFTVAKYVALGSALVQVSLGLIMYGQNNNPGSIHMFYGIVTLFTLAFAYIYRSTLAGRPGLRWGLLLLFVMGLGIRGWMNFGQSF
ncbi:MAG: hypothetical protein OEY55_10965 [Acidimicrobiia bacterium]|nr:hypothetical protein [Acidimicrobiia bacterium]MDH5422312.1 hypothetical protein [Acidimicrobiia bacterium]MDH5502879.1 hypothetical protein [Acidimicrobiia bacterium]